MEEPENIPRDVLREAPHEEFGGSLENVLFLDNKEFANKIQHFESLQVRSQVIDTPYVGFANTSWTWLETKRAELVRVV